MDKFDELKSNRFIKKLRSKAMAIVTGQIEIHSFIHSFIHSGNFKMNYLPDSINDIEIREEIDLTILNAGIKQSGLMQQGIRGIFTVNIFLKNRCSVETDGQKIEGFTY